MKPLGVLIAAVLLAWTSLIYARLRTAKRGILWLPVKLSASSFALETGLIGIAGAIVGTITGSRALLTTCAALAVAAGMPVLRTWLTGDVFTPIFGTRASGPYQVKHRWGIRLGKVPQPRLQQNIAFWTLPLSNRELLCDIWQPPEPSPATYVEREPTLATAR